MHELLLDVRDLTTRIAQRQAEVVPVRGVALHLKRGEVLGLVGESGCGKTTTGLSIMRLVPRAARISGEVFWRGEDLLTYTPRQMRALRGNRMAMVFQNPLTSLNPTETIGYQVEEAIQVHQPGVTADGRRARVEELLALVGVPDPEERTHSYPHELSGGMRQRVVIAMALANNPDLLIADEPTTALDMSIQAQILWLLEDLQHRLGMAMIYITHNLDVAASLCHRIAVMYGGQIVEQGEVEAVFEKPAHPYTQGLLTASPHGTWRTHKVQGIPGQPPNLVAGAVRGCAFAPRCPLAAERCHAEEPPPVPVAEGHTARCFAA